MNEFFVPILALFEFLEFLNPLTWIDIIVKLVVAISAIVVAIVIARFTPFSYVGKIIIILIGCMIAVLFAVFWGGI